MTATVTVIPADHGGCGWYRLRHPVAALHHQGHDEVTLRDTYPRALYQDTFLGTRLVEVDCDTDVIVFQRPLHQDVVDAIPALQRQGIAVVVEIDDDFEHLPKGHPARRGTGHHLRFQPDDPGRGVLPRKLETRAATLDVVEPPNHRRWLREACRRADLVTVSTPALADVYGGHGRVAVLPNLVPDTYLDVQAEGHDGAVRVGWTGSTHTHVGDLDVTGGAVADAIDDSHAALWIVGTGEGVEQGLGRAPDHCTGWVEIDDYPAAYALLDVAIVPLALNPFNEAKSWLKGLEAAALGVPFVASPTGPYRTLHDLGAGLLAATPDEWRRLVTRLACIDEARAEHAEAGRAVAAELTYGAHAWRWLEAWNEAVRWHRTRTNRSVA